MAPASPSPESLRADLARDGFVIIKSLLNPSELKTLREAAGRTTALGRSGQWPHVRILGKQFPPWDSDTSSGIWGVQHLMNPSLPDSKAFAEIYFSDAILGIVKSLLDCTDDDLVMELFNMLVRPERDFALQWHRDDIPPETPDAEELKRLSEPAFHAQYNLALYEDASLIVIPGSHARVRTSTEREADPMAESLPGQIQVKLEAGDIAFYDNNILHRGAYDSSKERMTLHGSVGHVKGERLRARNVLQHGVGAWVRSCDFGGLGGVNVGRRAEEMRRRLVRMGEEGGEVGYSLVG